MFHIARLGRVRAVLKTTSTAERMSRASGSAWCPGSEDQSPGGLAQKSKTPPLHTDFWSTRCGRLSLAAQRRRSLQVRRSFFRTLCASSRLGAPIRPDCQPSCNSRWKPLDDLYQRGRMTLLVLRRAFRSVSAYRWHALRGSGNS